MTRKEIYNKLVEELETVPQIKSFLRDCSFNVLASNNGSLRKPEFHLLRIYADFYKIELWFDFNVVFIRKKLIRVEGNKHLYSQKKEVLLKIYNTLKDEK